MPADPALQMQAAIRTFGEPTAEELDLINKTQSNVPLDKGDVFVFRTETSNDLRDSFFTRMDPSTTLENFVKDFRNGRSLQNSHRTEELPLGRSFDASLEQRGKEGDDNDPARTAAMVKSYMVRGLNLNGINTSDVIRGIETGVVRDVSVHFDDSARYQCSLCGQDMYERESTCPHMPGMTYSGKRAEALIVDGHALEHSLCFDGATPRAMVEKAQRLATAGKLNGKHIHRLEQLYHARIRNVPSAGGPPLAGGDRTPTAYEDRQKALMDALNKIYDGDDEWLYFDRTTDKDVAYTVSGGPKAGSYQSTYEIADAGEVTLGDPIPVTITTQVTPINRSQESAMDKEYQLKAAADDLPAERWVEMLPDHVRRDVDFIGIDDVVRRVNVISKGRFSLFTGGTTWEKANASQRATWATAYMNDLPDSAFAYIEADGTKDEEGKTTPRSGRYFPHHDDANKVDEAHVRNALARIPQSDVSDAAKASALHHVRAHAKSLGLEVEDDRSNSNGGNMVPLDVETFANLAGARMAVAERERIVDALIAGNPDEVTADLVNRVAGSIVKRAGPTLNGDVASQMQGILDQMSDAADSHAEAVSALKTLVGMGAEGGLQYGLPEEMASQEDLDVAQDPGLQTQDYGPGTTPNGSGNGTGPKNGVIGRSARSIAIGGGNGVAGLDAKVIASLAAINDIISDLLATDAHEEAQALEQGATGDAVPISSAAIGPGRSSDHEARAKRTLAFEVALKAPQFSALRTVVKQARAGRDYRKALAAELVSWGVRARGAEFNSSLYQRLLPSMELSQIEDLTKEFERDAWKRFANAPAEEQPDWLPSLVNRVGRQTVPGLLPGTPNRVVAAADPAPRINVEQFKVAPW